ncbi:MAG: helix-turn-helix domain-containing protein [Butyrivibrio sp.]|nr:helix-turn-helix domain-containing protein [Muribaculum sp.]MCM1552646.1 helix-turn-helix domain-containing protein [Butyrivibrio sp.]
MELKICENIKRLRKEMDISQEMLAERCGVSAQAVSKWETGLSMPDVSILPSIVDYFHVTMDEMFFGTRADHGIDISEVPQDVDLYIVQLLNGKIIGKDRFDKDTFINLKLEGDKKLSLHVWGSANINGDIKGSAEAGGGMSCGNVNGSVNAGDSVSCGGVNGSVSAGVSVTCANIEGNVSAGESVNCRDITGDIDCGDTIHCDKILRADHITCEKLYSRE